MLVLGQTDLLKKSKGIFFRYDFVFSFFRWLVIFIRFFSECCVNQYNSDEINFFDLFALI